MQNTKLGFGGAYCGQQIRADVRELSQQQYSTHLPLLSWHRTGVLVDPQQQWLNAVSFWWTVHFTEGKFQFRQGSWVALILLPPSLRVLLINTNCRMLCAALSCMHGDCAHYCIVMLAILKTWCTCISSCVLGMLWALPELCSFVLCVLFQKLG